MWDWLTWKNVRAFAGPCATVSTLCCRIMGKAKCKLSTTQQFIEQYPKCCFCGGLRRATTREHMPPKALFDRSHRPDKLIMPVAENAITERALRI